MNILVAEDDRDEAELYRSALQLNGHSATVTFDGRKCLDTYRYALHVLTAEGKKGSDHEPYDVVVIDFSMPELDGMRVAKEIIRLNPKQRIILASALVKETIVKRFKELNLKFEIMQKPFEPERLLALIESKSSVTRIA